MSKKQNIKKLLELNELVNTGGDINRIKELRAELGIKIEEEKLSKEELELERMLTSYHRLRSLGLRNMEIAYALKIGTAKVSKLEELSDDTFIEELMALPVVQKYYKHTMKR